MSFGYSSYSNIEGEVLAASPIGLVRLLYRGALDAIAVARQHLRSGDITARSRAITKAQEIVAELTASLKAHDGRDLVRTLDELYAFVQQCLARANFLQIEQPLADAECVLRSLEAAWTELDPARATDVPGAVMHQPGTEQRRWIG